MEKCKIALVGTGMIGAGLAISALLHEHPVTLYDVIEPEKIRATVKDILSIMVNCGAASQEQANAAYARSSYTQDLGEAVAGAAFIQECIPERLELKQNTYRRIQEQIGDAAVIASSTSGLFPSKLQAGALHPEKILVGHPYNPAYLLPLVELCGGEKTAPETIEIAQQVYKSIGKVPVLCRKEHEGFIVNKLSWMLADAAKELVQDGICSVEDLDKALMFGPGMRLAVTGQLLTLSLGVEGGFRGIAVKYGKEPSPLDEIIAQGIDEELALRPPETGNTPKEVCAYRDRFFAGILRLHGLIS